MDDEESDREESMSHSVTESEHSRRSGSRKSGEGAQAKDNPDKDSDGDVAYIGPLTEKQRLSKVRSYLTKKYNKAFSKKHCYTCRKSVAEKRLRIKGRFVTREQAFVILGLSEDQLLTNDKIQDLLTQHAEEPL